jgi:hypothetical protein
MFFISSTVPLKSCNLLHVVWISNFKKKVLLFKIWLDHIEISIGSLSNFDTMWGLWEKTYSCTSWNRKIIMYLLKVMKSSFTYDSTMNNYVPCVTNYVWYYICTRELLYVWMYIPPTARSSQKQQPNKEHQEATSQWGAAKRNNTHKECPKVATQVGTPISNIMARSFPRNNNKTTH